MKTVREGNFIYFVAPDGVRFAAVDGDVEKARQQCLDYIKESRS